MFMHTFRNVTNQFGRASIKFLNIQILSNIVFKKHLACSIKSGLAIMMLFYICVKTDYVFIISITDFVSYSQFYYEQQMYMQMQYGMVQHYPPAPTGYTTAFAPYGQLAPHQHHQHNPNILVPIDATVLQQLPQPVVASSTPQQEHFDSSAVPVADVDVAIDGDAVLETTNNNPASSSSPDLQASSESTMTATTLTDTVTTTDSTTIAISTTGGDCNIEEPQQQQQQTLIDNNHMTAPENGNVAYVSPFLSPNSAIPNTGHGTQYFYAQPTTPVAMAPQVNCCISSECCAFIFV